MSTLACAGLEFGYPKHPSIITNFDLEVTGGQMLGITGGSGRGKSTLLYLLGLMLTPRAGVVLLNGEPVSGLRDAARSTLRANQFGFVFQDAALDHTRTVIDNIVEVSLYGEIGRSDARVRGLELMRKLGVDTPADRRPGQISGGQAQRIALCRALVHQPDLVLADEPTGNLDDASAAGVIGALRAHADQDGITIVVTHDPRVEAACDRVIRL